MVRVARVDAGDHVYHVINRAVGRLTIFDTPDDYRLFIDLLREAKEMTDMRILAYVIMPNHWHLLLSKLPVALPRKYRTWINTPDSEKDLDSLRVSVNRGAPYGNARWVEQMVDTYKLTSTIRKPGRPTGV